jgi:Activator of Hsp90 ATPase homolog 1-like protein
LYGAPSWDSNCPANGRYAAVPVKQANAVTSTAAGGAGEFFSRLDMQPQVTFDIEPVTQGVKLTVIHDGFEPGSTIVQMVSVGWPDVISSLKSLLETGEPLPA